LFNTRADESKTLNQVYVLDGKLKYSVQKLTTGYIGATTKLTFSETNDILASDPDLGTIKLIKFPQPRLVKVVFAENTSNKEKLRDVLRRMHSQDLTLALSYNSEIN
jgi:elongation factor G